MIVVKNDKNMDAMRYTRRESLHGYIRERVPEGELMALVAEEATELAQAALKLRRSCGLAKNNPTPMTKEEAYRKLREELSDLDTALEILYPTLREEPQYHTTYDMKLERWADRLGEREMAEKLRANEGKHYHEHSCVVSHPNCLCLSCAHDGESCCESHDRVCRSTNYCPDYEQESAEENTQDKPQNKPDDYILGVAETLRDYCAGREDCEECPFVAEDGCIVRQPETWPDEEEME